jgi:hypothetical protein
LALNACRISTFSSTNLLYPILVQKRPCSMPAPCGPSRALTWAWSRFPTRQPSVTSVTVWNATISVMTCFDWSMSIWKKKRDEGGPRDHRGSAHHQCARLHQEQGQAALSGDGNRRARVISGVREQAPNAKDVTQRKGCCHHPLSDEEHSRKRSKSRMAQKWNTLSMS